MILTLSSERVRNTVFMDERGLPVFKADTPFRLGLRTTTILRQSDSVTADAVRAVGRIDWRPFGQSMFTINGMTLKSNAFLPRGGIFSRKRTFIGPDGRRYRWDTYHWDVALSVDDGSHAEIARYHRGGFRFFGGRCAYLEIAPQAEHMLDLVILTFVYVEKLRMDSEKQRRRGASSGGGP